MSTISQSMDFEDDPRAVIDDLYSSDDDECLQGLIRTKNIIIGSDRQKGNFIRDGLSPQVVQLILACERPIQLRNEAVIVLNSLAKGTPSQVKEILKQDLVFLLLTCLLHPDDSEFAPIYVENCLKCLASLFRYDFTPRRLLFRDHNVLSGVLKLTMNSIANQISVTTIFANAIKCKEHQTKLWDEGAVFMLTALLGSSPLQKVQLPTLACITAFCHENNAVASSFVTASFEGKSVPDLLISLMGQDKEQEMRMAAAKCVVNLFRAGALSSDHPAVMYKALSVLVSLCQCTVDWTTRVKAAEVLSYMIQNDQKLQNLASISNQLPTVLASYVNFKEDGVPHYHVQEARNKLLQAGLLVFAALASSEESIRKKISETENLMEHLVNGLENSNLKIKLAAVKCLHSLSRSVRELRTIFQDHTVWKPLVKIIEMERGEILVAATSTICNLLLGFAPTKDPLLNAGITDLLCNVYRKNKNSELRLNVVWAFMNMAYESDQNVKQSIIDKFGIDEILSLLRSSHSAIIIKTLGLLRNLLSTTAHIDYITEQHGEAIMTALVGLLSKKGETESAEQALCVLANIAEGDKAKALIIDNEEVLELIRFYMPLRFGKSREISATSVGKTLKEYCNKYHPKSLTVT